MKEAVRGHSWCTLTVDPELPSFLFCFDFTKLITQLIWFLSYSSETSFLSFSLHSLTATKVFVCLQCQQQKTVNFECWDRWSNSQHWSECKWLLLFSSVSTRSSFGGSCIYRGWKLVWCCDDRWFSDWCSAEGHGSYRRIGTILHYVLLNSRRWCIAFREL